MRRCGLLLSGLRMLRGISDMFSMEENEFVMAISIIAPLVCRSFSFEGHLIILLYAQQSSIEEW